MPRPSVHKRRRSPTRVRASWCVVSMFLFLVGCASTPSGPWINKGLPNFVSVDAHLYRGAQPGGEGYAELSRMGVETLVDLRGAGEQPPTREAEKRAAENERIEYIAEPMAGLGAPSKEAVRRVLSVINDPKKQPVFVHCKRGADRTGTIVAIYRITHDCWTADRAIQEAREHGMSRLEFGMRRLIRDWYEEVKAQVCTPPG